MAGRPSARSGAGAGEKKRREARGLAQAVHVNGVAAEGTHGRRQTTCAELVGTCPAHLRDPRKPGNRQ